MVFFHDFHTPEYRFTGLSHHICSQRYHWNQNDGADEILARFPKPTGISDSSMALALSVKNMICDVDSTTTKNALAAATALPLIRVSGMDNAKIPTMEEAAVVHPEVLERL